jgi:hypothetical protein
VRITNSGNVEVQGNIRINDQNLLLRSGSETDDGIAWHGANKPFAGTQVDGPVVFGRSGGALGSKDGEEKLALRWDASRNVRIGMAPIQRPRFVTKQETGSSASTGA